MKEQNSFNQTLPKTSGRKYILLCLFIATVNIFMWFVVGKTNQAYPNRSLQQTLMGKFLILYTGIVLLGFIIGIVASLVPFKGLSFGQKYLRFSLLAIIFLSVLFLMFLIRTAIVFP